ncbi:hypothetical protein BCR44DRAFT_1439796 [Catenaria anguillulae PL171]|uniref:Protein kinase domain-containing protein n=1 Tax=Catenaria anguillulae PL171 TaxID=765915 RepID=A0A1Y2HFD9_9FUNG|nr:hypothetical protein BCR44DRAFT_1439796 [Catenaria anguillulae PL171]
MQCTRDRDDPIMPPESTTSLLMTPQLSTLGDYGQVGESDASAMMVVDTASPDQPTVLIPASDLDTIATTTTVIQVIQVQLDRHVLTASSLIFTAQSVSSAQSSQALIVKLARTNLPVLSTIPHPDTVQRILNKALEIHNLDLEKQRDAAAATAAAKRSHSNLTLGMSASSSLSNLLSNASAPNPAAMIPSSNVNGINTLGDESVPLDAESKIFSSLVTTISSKYSNAASKLAHLVIPAGTLAHGHILLLPRHRPLQPDFRTPQLPLVEVARLATHLVHALTTMHSAGWVHCDVSNNNIVIACNMCDRELANVGFGGDSSSIPRCPHVSLASPPQSDSASASSLSPDSSTSAKIDDPHPKRIYRLIDFGLAQKIEDTAAVSMVCGTPGFTAPEAFACNQVPAPPPITANMLTGDNQLYAPFPRSTSANHLPKSSSQLHMASSISATGELTHTIPPPRSSPIPITSPQHNTFHHHPALAHSPLRPSGFSTSHMSSSYLSHSSSYDNLSYLGSCSLESLPLLSSTTHTTLASTNIRDAHSWTSLQSRITAARDIYSLGIVIGLMLSSYLPLCDADHLGSPLANPEYVSTRIKPRLMAMRSILRAVPDGRVLNTAVYPPDGLRVLEWLVDFVVRCLAHSAKRRPTAKRLLYRHPLCIWVRGQAPESDRFRQVPDWLQEAGRWKRSQEYKALKEAMEDRRREWEVAASGGEEDGEGGEDGRRDEMEVDLNGEVDDDEDDDEDDDHGLVIGVTKEYV